MDRGPPWTEDRATLRAPGFGGSVVRALWKVGAEPVSLSPTALLRLLEELHAAQEPFLVELVRDDGASLGIGVGRVAVPVSFVRADKEPPYLSAATSDPRPDSPGHFFYFGHWSEFRPQHLIPWPDALRCAHRFAETGELDPSADWQPV